MSTPVDAPKAIQEFTWVFNVDGQEKKIVTNGSYPTVQGDYVSVETKVIDEGFTPSILDFSIESADEDLTDFFLNEEKLLMIVSYNLDTAEMSGLQKLKTLSVQAQTEGYTVIGLSASGEDTIAEINATYGLDFEFYLCDEKALKTVVRSNPGVLQLNRGTVQQKVHWNDIEKLDL
jgi:ribosome-binding ATPase YchF (GTP1/OBG family)